jgi:putative peptidoglycan lipid II flippase
MRYKYLIKHSFVITIGTVLGMGMVLFREIIVAKLFGAGVAVDAYNIASLIPEIFQNILLSSYIGLLFTPFYIDLFKKDSKEKAFDFVSELLTLITIISVFIIVIVLLINPYIIPIIGAGLSYDSKLLAIKLANVLGFTIPLGLYVGILKEVLNIDEKYKIPSFMSLVMNIPLIIFIYIFYRELGIYSLVYGMIIGIFFQLGILLYFSYDIGYIFKLKLSYRSPLMKKFIKSALPVFGLVILTYIPYVYHRYLLSMLGEGVVSWYTYAYKLVRVPIKIYSLTLILLMFIDISKKIASNQKNEIIEIFRKGLKVSILLILPMVVFIYNFSFNVVEVLLARGKFSLLDTEQVSMALSIFSPYILIVFIFSVYNIIVWGLKEIKPLVKITLITSVINLVLSYLGARYFGLNGVIFAVNVSLLVGIVLIRNIVKRRVESFHDIRKEEIVFSIKIMFAAIFSLMVLNYILRVLPTPGNKYYELLINTTIYTITYILFVFSMRLKEVEYLLLKIRSKFDLNP